jgi:chromate transporter
MPTSNPEPAGAKPAISEVFVSFLKLGLSAFGGPAMVTYVKALAVDKKRWLDEETFSQGIALCQTLPGAIAVNTASYAGYRARGFGGMLAAFAGFTLPAFLLMLMLSVIYVKTRSLPIMNSLFNGLEVIVVGIVAHATATFGKRTLLSGRDVGIALAAAALLALKLNPFLVIVASACAGIILFRRTGAQTGRPVQGPGVANRDALTLFGLFVLSLLALWIVDRKLFDLAWVMAKIELFAFGGGYTALTLMFHEIVEVRQWIDHQTLIDGIALGQITPGPILITAAFIGYKVGGFAGALVGTLAIFMPGLLLIVIVLPFFDRLRANPVFFSAIRGIVSCFVGLLLFVTIKFALAVHWDWRHLLLLAASMGTLFAKVDILYVVLGGAVLSVLLL